MIEKKVTVSTVAAALTSIVLAVLGAYVFPGGVPEPVGVVIAGLASGLVTFVAGYLANHTPRNPPTE